MCDDFKTEAEKALAEGLDEHGRSLKTGKFVKGFTKPGPGRPKGSRNKLTQKMLDMVEDRDQKGLSPVSLFFEIMQDESIHYDLRYKAAAKIADLVYPKASSVEVKMETEDMTPEQIDERLRQLIFESEIDITNRD